MKRRDISKVLRYIEESHIYLEELVRELVEIRSQLPPEFEMVVLDEAITHLADEELKLK